MRKQGQSNFLLGSMEIAQNIVKSLSAIENEEIHQAGLRSHNPGRVVGNYPACLSGFELCSGRFTRV